MRNGKKQRVSFVTPAQKEHAAKRSRQSKISKNTYSVCSRRFTERHLSRKRRAHFLAQVGARFSCGIRRLGEEAKVVTAIKAHGGSGAHRYFIENCTFCLRRTSVFQQKKRAFFQSAKQSKMKKYFCIYFLEIPPQYSLTIDGGSGSIYLYDFTP